MITSLHTGTITSETIVEINNACLATNLINGMDTTVVLTPRSNNYRLTQSTTEEIGKFICTNDMRHIISPTARTTIMYPYCRCKAINIETGSTKSDAHSNSTLICDTTLTGDWNYPDKLRKPAVNVHIGDA